MTASLVGRDRSLTDVRKLDEHTMESRGERHDPASRRERQPAVKLTTIVAAGFAAAVAAFFTSRFGIAGTVLGTAATAMIITAGSAVIGFFFEYAADKARVLPGTLHVRTPRRSVLLGGRVAAAASFLIGMAAVTGVELGVGKNLSCWVWEECPAQTSHSGAASDTTTRPSILGGGQRIADTSVQPGDSKQLQRAAPERQEPPHFPQVPRQQAGSPPERNDPKPPATLEQNAPVLGTPGEEAPGQTRQRSQSDNQASPSQPSPTDKPPAEEPPPERSVRPTH
jgi:hypothetical protein